MPDAIGKLLSDNMMSILAFLASTASTIFYFGRKQQKQQDVVDSKIEELTRRMDALEKLVPREIDRVEKDMNEKFDLLMDMVKVIQEDVKSILKTAPQSGR